MSDLQSGDLPDSTSEPTVSKSTREPTEFDSVITDMWTWAKRQAIGKMELSYGARECWRILDGFPHGRCYPSHAFLAETLRRSVPAVCRYLRELKRRGYIQITPQYEADVERLRGRPRSRRPRSRGQTSNSYKVLDQEDLIARARQILQDWYAKQKK